MSDANELRVENTGEKSKLMIVPVYTSASAAPLTKLGWGQRGFLKTIWFNSD